MVTVAEVGKGGSTALDVLDAERREQNFRKYFPEVQQALATGMGASGWQVIVDDEKAGAWVDLRKKHIHVPSIGEGNLDKLKVARGFIDHELGHVRYTTRSLVKGPAGEVLFPIVSNLIEDIRCDQQTISEFPGCRVNLDNLYSIMNRDMQIPETTAKELKDLYEFMSVSYGNNVLGLHEEMKAGNMFEPLMADYKFIGAKSTTEARKLAAKLCVDMRQILKDWNPPPPADGNGDKPDTEGAPSKGDGDPSDKMDKDSKGDKDGEKSDEKSKDGAGDEADEKEKSESGDKSEEQGEGADKAGENPEESGDGKTDKSKGEKPVDGAGEESDSDGEDESESEKPEGTMRDDIPKDGSDKSGEHGSPDEIQETPENKISLEDFEKGLKDIKFDMSDYAKTELKGAEKEYREYTAYTADDIEITPNAVSKTTPFFEALMRETAKTQGHMMAQMIRMYKQERPVPTRRQFKGSIDTQSLCRPFLGESDIFIKKVRQSAYDISYSLLIDMSGSMSGYKVDAAFQAAIVFSKCLEALRIPNEILGFTTEGYSSPARGKFRRTVPLKHYIFKSFNEKFNWITQGRIEVVLKDSPLCHNVDGESVQWAANRLKARREQKKVLIVMSDGLPEDGKGRTDLEEHLKKTIKSLRKEMTLIGVGIRTNAVAEFYPEYVILKDLADLAKTVLTKIEQQLIRS